MEFHHSLDRAEHCAVEALARMKQHGIAPHPNNFTVWYCHASGEWPELSHTLDVLAAADGAFDEDRSALVFKKFCSVPFEALPLHLIAEKIEAELTAVMAALDQAGRSACEYGRLLETASAQAASAPREGLRQVVARMLSETRAMAMRSRKLEQRLNASLLEAERLKLELEGARTEALTDPLTGLANRKMFEAVLRDAVVRTLDSGEPLSLMLLDIDNFKAFNDDYGHLVGDQVLKLLAVVLRENLKGQDTAARYGGEEFAVVLPNTAGADARKLADGIRHNISEKKLVNRTTGKKLRQITASVGVAQFAPTETVSQFIERADRGLYFAKRLGRNRVIAGEDVHAAVPAVS